jgi:putative transposase
LTFQLLSCFFVIEHRRRRILHFNVTREPTAAWVVQQLRDVFPGDGPHRFVLFDHDSTFDGNVIAFLKATSLDPRRTGIQAPGKTASRSAGWAAADATSSTRSSR